MADEQMDSTQVDTDPGTPDPQSDSWLSMARDAYEQSSDWFDVSLRPSIEKAMAHFANRHAPGSKYYSEGYKFRSKGFRPKTRATIRRNEAAAAVAFFSTQDMVSIAAENDGDKHQVMSASVLTELLNYRLDDTIPWFLTLVGAYQNALNVGVVVSHQSWDFEESVEQYPVMDEAGQPALMEDGQPATQEVRKILTDKPRVDLVAIENIRISPAADWTDAMGTTPYIVELIPMFIGDVKEKMAAGKWIEYDDGKIKQATSGQYDTIRAAREGKKRADSLDLSHVTSDFDTVWVHRNIIRKDGKDVLFYTLGTHLRLSDPVPLSKEYRHLRPGERPYTMGFAILEAHKPIPPGLNELTSTLQEETNDIGNQRRDNVALVMNKRYFAKRTATVDYKSLTRNVPGSVTLVDDINTDIRWDSPGEVTSSAYAEQDRINLDYDELSGSFSPGSVQSNRQLNETVGGMNLLSADANVITEYQLRVFAESWVEPTMKQLVRMEQAYETDPMILAICGNRAKLFEKFGVSQINDALLQGMVKVRVNVGFGATNPEKRVQRLATGLQSVVTFAPQAMQGVNTEEVITEIFGSLGYKGAERFFPNLGKQQADPQVQALQAQIQQLQQIIQTKQIESQGREKVETIRQEGNMAVAQVRSQTEKEIEKLRAEVDAIDARLSREVNQIDIGRLQNERAALIHEMNRAKTEDVLSATGNRAMSQTMNNGQYGMIPGQAG